MNYDNIPKKVFDQLTGGVTLGALEMHPQIRANTGEPLSNVFPPPCPINFENCYDNTTKMAVEVSNHSVHEINKANQKILEIKSTDKKSGNVYNQKTCNPPTPVGPGNILPPDPFHVFEENNNLNSNSGNINKNSSQRTGINYQLNPSNFGNSSVLESQTINRIKQGTVPINNLNNGLNVNIDINGLNNIINGMQRQMQNPLNQVLISPNSAQSNTPGSLAANSPISSMQNKIHDEIPSILGQQNIQFIGSTGDNSITETRSVGRTKLGTGHIISASKSHIHIRRNVSSAESTKIFILVLEQIISAAENYNLMRKASRDFNPNEKAIIIDRSNFFCKTTGKICKSKVKDCIKEIRKDNSSFSVKIDFAEIGNKIGLREKTVFTHFRDFTTTVPLQVYRFCKILFIKCLPTCFETRTNKVHKLFRREFYKFVVSKKMPPQCEFSDYVPHRRVASCIINFANQLKGKLSNEILNLLSWEEEQKNAELGDIHLKLRFQKLLADEYKCIYSEVEKNKDIISNDEYIIKLSTNEYISDRLAIIKSILFAKITQEDLNNEKLLLESKDDSDSSIDSDENSDDLSGSTLINQKMKNNREKNILNNTQENLQHQDGCYGFSFISTNSFNGSSKIDPENPNESNDNINLEQNSNEGIKSQFEFNESKKENVVQTNQEQNKGESFLDSSSSTDSSYFSDQFQINENTPTLNENLSSEIPTEVNSITTELINTFKANITNIVIKTINEIITLHNSAYTFNDIAILALLNCLNRELSNTSRNIKMKYNKQRLININNFLFDSSTLLSYPNNFQSMQQSLLHGNLFPSKQEKPNNNNEENIYFYDDIILMISQPIKDIEKIIIKNTEINNLMSLFSHKSADMLMRENINQPYQLSELTTLLLKYIYRIVIHYK